MLRPVIGSANEVIGPPATVFPWRRYDLGPTTGKPAIRTKAPPRPKSPPPAPG